MAEPAQVRLERLLYVLPVAARRGGAPLDELSAELDVEKKELLRDLHEATARIYYLPAGDGDLIQITIDEDRVRVFAGRHFHRPIRLSPLELVALGIGLRVLAAEQDADRRAYLSALARRLERALRGQPRPEPAGGAGAGSANRSVSKRPGRAPAEAWAGRTRIEIEPEQAGIEVNLRGDDLRGLFSDAVRQRRRVALRYLKPGAQPQDRTLEPLRLVYANGRWYVLGRAPGQPEARVFRLDRVLDAHVTSEPFEAAAFEPAALIDEAGHAYGGGDAVIATVRYSANVARWICERTGRKADADGTVTVEHRVADADWLARHVLQYGADAEVITPVNLRAHVARVASRMAGLTPAAAPPAGSG